MPDTQVIHALARIAADESERIARRWADAAGAERTESGTAGKKELREPLVGWVRDLARQLASHGPEAPAIFGETLRKLGGLRFEQRFGAADVVREVEALGGVLLDEYARLVEPPTLEAVRFVRELVVAATAGAMDDYVKRVRASRTHMREAGTIETIVRHIAEGLVAVEHDGTISWVSEPAARILGCRPSDLMGKRPREVAAALARANVRDDHGDEIREDDLPFQQAIEAARPTKPRLLRVTQADGERLVETDAIPIKEEGELRGAVWSLRDRTDEIRAQEQARRAYDELRALHVRLLRRTRSQALGEVANQVSGALKNSMNAIRLRLRLAADAGVDPALIGPMEGTVDEMARLVTQLQDLSSSRLEDETATVALDEVAREALDLVRPELTAAAEGRELKIDAALRSGAVVAGSRADLREAIVHCLLDAMEALPEGGTIAVATVREGREARASVKALAAGVDEPRYENQVEARVAAGTSATPVAPPVARRREGPVSSVLVVDDDDDNREMLAALLETHGLSVTQAATAAEARALADEANPDAALVDLAMPDASGWDVSRDLRARHPDMRIALVTGYESAATAAMRPDGGVEAVFPKPVDVTRVLAFLGLKPEEHVRAHEKEISP